MFILQNKNEPDQFGVLGRFTSANPKRIALMARVRRPSAQEFTKDDAVRYANDFDMIMVDLDADLSSSPTSPTDPS